MGDLRTSDFGFGAKSSKLIRISDFGFVQGSRIC